jgi:hypothetical protein
MSTSLEDVLARFSAEDRKEIEEGTRKMIDAERTLRDLRRASELADEELVDLLGATWDALALSDRLLELKLASIGRFLEAMGGDLQLVARMPGREPIAVALADLFPRDPDHESVQDPPAGDALRLAR